MDKKERKYKYLFQNLDEFRESIFLAWKHVEFYYTDVHEAFHKEELIKGTHWLYADVTCPQCNKVFPYLQLQSTNNKCIRCGAKCH